MNDVRVVVTSSEGTQSMDCDAALCVTGTILGNGAALAVIVADAQMHQAAVMLSALVRELRKLYGPEVLLTVKELLAQPQRFRDFDPPGTGTS